MLVVPEGGGDLEIDMTLILDGHTTIEHALPMAPLQQRRGHALRPEPDLVHADAARGLRRNLRATSGSTSTTTCGRTSGLQRYVPQARDRHARPDPQHHGDRSRRLASHRRRRVGQDRSWTPAARVCLGGHGQMQGLGPHWEMWAFVQGGMTPLEALRVATLFPAQTLGLDARPGLARSRQARRLRGPREEPARGDREQRDGHAGREERHGLETRGASAQEAGIADGGYQR